MAINIENENIRKFLDKLGKDKELQEKFSQIRDPGEAYKLAASVQDGFTKEEFVTEMKRLYEEMTKDLSDEDLAKVAGGGSDEELALSLTFVGVSTSVVSTVIVGLEFGASAAAVI
ncbi:Nif11-like leader peptide family RiPP precursor [Selenomonas sp. KH1T6]|uniref:Nif11-like leader peptide family RiPP precursor n=1 Tax=Selenomonas sp. KH1T6 TaxID=3158784 RepID=UPI0008A7480E|nr:nif11-like leader peptide domain-containing protein [Selenomonas ruminantium]